MKLKIKYFGSLSEIAGGDEESLVFTGSKIYELLEVLYAKYPALAEKDFQVAQDSSIIAKDSVISGGEIALLPPFSGG